MATRNATPSTRPRRDDLVVDDRLSDWTRYEGTRDSLVERAGIPAAAFDDANRCSANIWRMHDGERRIEVRRRASRSSSRR